jgi:iron complex transport system ATP-binding protein
MSVLAAENIGLSLDGKRILDSVSHTFRRGRVTALLGPNGAGKSTLLDCLAALRKPDDGAATLDGQDVQRIDRRLRARAIGLLPQAADVHWNIDVATLVGLADAGARPRRTATRSLARWRRPT